MDVEVGCAAWVHAAEALFVEQEMVLLAALYVVAGLAAHFAVDLD